MTNYNYCIGDIVENSWIDFDNDTKYCELGIITEIDNSSMYQYKVQWLCENDNGSDFYSKDFLDACRGFFNVWT